MTQINYRAVLELTCRLYVFLFLNVYGFAKLFDGQFYRPHNIPPDIAAMPIAQVPDFELAWTFMGRSFGYLLFIGLGEIIGAWLLLFNKTKLIGVAILLPIMANIIVFDIFFLDAYGALASATIYSLMLLTILYLNRKQVVESFKKLVDFQPASGRPLKSRLIFYGTTILLMALIFLVDQLFVNWLGHGKG